MGTKYINTDAEVLELVKRISSLYKRRCGTGTYRIASVCILSLAIDERVSASRPERTVTRSFFIILHAWLDLYYSDLLIVRSVYSYRRLSILPPLPLPVILCLERELLLDIATGTGPGLEPAAVGIVDI